MWFDRIVPCGISDAGVTSLSQELVTEISAADVLASANLHIDRVFGHIEVLAKTPN